MPSRDDRRRLLGPDLSDRELDEFLGSLRAFLAQFLDEYFRAEFEPVDSDP